MKIDDFISFFKKLIQEEYKNKRLSIPLIFMHGGCFEYAKVLKRYYNGIFVVDDEEIISHCAFFYEGKQYDIEGEKREGFYKDIPFRIATFKDIDCMNRSFFSYKELPKDLQEIVDNDLDPIYILSNLLSNTKTPNEYFSIIKRYHEVLLKDYGKSIKSEIRIDASKKASAFLLAVLKEDGVENTIIGIEGAIAMCIASVFKRDIKVASDILTFKQHLDPFLLPFIQSVYALLQKEATPEMIEEIFFDFYSHLLLEKKKIGENKNKAFSLKMQYCS